MSLMPKTKRIGIICLTVLAACFFYGGNESLTSMVLAGLLVMVDPKGDD